MTSLKVGDICVFVPKEDMSAKWRVEPIDAMFKILELNKLATGFTSSDVVEVEVLTDGAVFSSWGPLSNNWNIQNPMRVGTKTLVHKNTLIPVEPEFKVYTTTIVSKYQY